MHYLTKARILHTPYRTPKRVTDYINQDTMKEHDIIRILLDHAMQHPPKSEHQRHELDKAIAEAKKMLEINSC